MPVPSTRTRSVAAESSQDATHEDVKKNSFLSNVFGKLHTPGKKKTPAREDRGHGGLGTVRKLLPFSPSRIPKSSSKVDKYSAVKNTTTSPPKDTTGGRPRKRLGGLVPSPVRLFSVSDQEELIPAARGDPGTSLNIKEDSTSIQVVVRVRPKGDCEQQTRVVSVGNQGASGLPDTITLQPSMGERHAFTFDTVMNEDKTQLDVYQASGRSVLENCLNGYHGCLFAYGQTGSGKTYSMMGSTELCSPMHDDLSRGIIQRSFDDLFSIMEAKVCI